MVSFIQDHLLLWISKRKKDQKTRLVTTKFISYFFYLILDICITSYNVVVQDQHIFRRKDWNLIILDEAHHIKNFKTKKWQTLLNFKSKNRLLLTGTPLQNSVMELWSLMHFLMPDCNLFN
jgi:SNF2 family DNA or RNA helicase